MEGTNSQQFKSIIKSRRDLAALSSANDPESKYQSSMPSSPSMRTEYKSIASDEYKQNIKDLRLKRKRYPFCNK